MRITGAQVFDLQEGFVQRDICFDGRLLSGSSADGKTYDASGCYVIPGLTDVHFHGCMGRDFSDAEPEGLEIMAQYELSRGVTQICPAGMTLTEEQLTKIVRWPPPIGPPISPAPPSAASIWRDPSSPWPKRAHRTARGSTPPTWLCSAA